MQPVSRMLEVQSLYKPSSPQQPTVKRRRLRLSSVPLVDLRSTSLPGTSSECEEAQARFSLITAHPGDSPGSRLMSKSGICSVSEGMDGQKAGSSSVRIKHLTNNWEGKSRFPKLDECAHFHYEFVELGPVQVCLYDESQENSKALANGENERGEYLAVQVTSAGKSWVVRRTYENFRMLDEQLHRCIYDRKFSALQEIPKELSIGEDEDPQDAIRSMLTEYLERFSTIAGNLINCGPVLNWLELDNRGNRLIVTDDSAINTPAVAAAYVIKRYTAQASDEISFEVGDMISVIDMPPPEESIWWRGKKGFEVGFFPCECVEVIGDKVPQSINIPKAPTKPVLRKHGKLISFFRSFILSRPSRRKLKQSGILKERVFGCDLGEHLLNSGHEIPMVLKCCAEFIEAHGIVDGIYRLSGITSNIQKLRNAFDEDRVPNLNDDAILQDIHCVASLLKMYFRELPNPLLTYQLYDKFVTAVQSGENVRLMNMRDVVQQLPPPHYRTLEYLVRHLARVASHGTETGMTPKNVAIVWAPNLLRSKELEIGSVAALQVVGVQAIVTEYLIRYVELIFNDKLPIFPTTSSGSGTPKKTRPKSLAISTPTKLLSLEEARSRALSSSNQSQQKYIEVGGGPATLPSKYHTVIDLPDRKRGSTKLKKSPSGWKSFFKGKSQSQGGKDKGKVQRKASTPTSQGPCIAGSEKAVTEADVSYTHGKRLRSVKSAESLVSCGGSASHRNSEALDIGVTFSDDMSKSASGRITFDIQLPSPSSLSANDAAPSRVSPHTHVRSVSHDSYFELSPDTSHRNGVMADLLGSGNLQLQTSEEPDKSSERLVLEDFQDVAADINHIRVSFDNDLDFLSAGTDDNADISEHAEDDIQVSQHELHEVEVMGKSPKKHRWKQGAESESASPKSKLSLKEKFKQAFTSPPASRKLDSSGSDGSEDSSLKGSLKRTPSTLKEKIYHALSPESLRRKQLSGVDNLGAEEDEQIIKKVSASPSQSPKTKQRKWTNIEEEVPNLEENQDTDKKELENLVQPVNAETSHTESSTKDPTHIPPQSEKIVVERYGSEKTIIVEVHATQESSTEEENETPTTEETATRDTIDMCPQSIWSPTDTSEIKEFSQSPVSYHSSVQGEYGSPTSVGATISDNETLSVSMVDSEMFDGSLFEQPSEDGFQFTSELTTPETPNTENVSELMDNEASVSNLEFQLDTPQQISNNVFDIQIFLDNQEELSDKESVTDQMRSSCLPQSGSEISTPTPAEEKEPAGLGELETVTLPQSDSAFVEKNSILPSLSKAECFVPLLSPPDTVEDSDHLFPKQSRTSDQLLSPTDKIDSDSSTPSVATSGEGAFCITSEVEGDMFGYTVLIDETEGGDEDHITTESAISDSNLTMSEESFVTSEITHKISDVNLEESKQEPKTEDNDIKLSEEIFRVLNLSPVISSKTDNLPKSDEVPAIEKVTTPTSVASVEFLDSCTNADKNGTEITIEQKAEITADLTEKVSVCEVKESAREEDLFELVDIQFRTDKEDHRNQRRSDRFSFPGDRISPLEDSKRRFESEIGRDILHERKMKLELEKIQLEQRTDRTSPCKMETRPCPRALPSPLDVKSSLFIHGTVPTPQEARDSVGLPQSSTKMNSSGDLKNEVGSTSSSMPNGLMCSELEGVELRHPSSRSEISSSSEEAKRNSEPLPLKMQGSVLPQESKRHSEPPMAFVPKCLRPEKKASVKELMSKFEVRTRSDSSSDSSIEATVISQKPPLFTKPKMVKLQALSPSASESQKLFANQLISDKIKADDIKSAAELSDNSSEKDFEKDIFQPKAESSQVPVFSQESDTSQSSSPAVPITLSQEFSSEDGEPVSLTVSRKTESSGEVQITMSSREKVAVRLSAPAELLEKSESEKDELFGPNYAADAYDTNQRRSSESAQSRSVKATTIHLLETDHETNSPDDELSARDIFALISSADSNDLARRERIDRYKEERRAQLRERIRTESFKLDKEEKSEYLARLKQKAVSPNHVEEEPTSFGARRRIRSVAMISPSEGESVGPPRFRISATDMHSPSKEMSIPPKSPKKVSKDSMIPTLTSDHNGSSRTSFRLSKDEAHESISNLESPKSKLVKPKWPPVNESIKDGNVVNKPVPARRTVRTGSDSDALENRKKESDKGLQRRGSLGISRSEAKTSPTKERPRDLPFRELKETSPERRRRLSPKKASPSERKSLQSPTKEKVPSPLKERRDFRSSRTETYLKPKPSSKKISPDLERDSSDLSKSSPTESSGEKAPRRIKEVAAMFERESSSASKTSSSPAMGRSVLSASGTRTQRSLSQTSEDGLESNVGNNGLRKKPSQYLSAV